MEERGESKIVGRPKGKPNNSGTPLTPRRINGNIDWTKVYSGYIRSILETQIAPNTLRGIMYILKSRNILKKSDYGGLTNHFRDWRMEGLIDWDAVADGSGRGVINDFTPYEVPSKWAKDYIDYLRNGGKNYRDLLKTKWRWSNQPHYVEIWVEKHALAGTVSKLIPGRYVRVAYNKGNPGWGYMHDNCERLMMEMNLMETPRKIHILYLGDWDKIGRHMDIELEEQLQYFGLWDKVDFKRIALLPSQIQEYRLPENWESGEGYEVDSLHAFDPVAFKKLLLGEIDQWFNKDIHKQVLKETEAKRIDDLIRSKIRFLQV